MILITGDGDFFRLNTGLKVGCLMLISHGESSAQVKGFRGMRLAIRVS